MQNCANHPRNPDLQVAAEAPGIWHTSCTLGRFEVTNLGKKQLMISNRSGSHQSEFMQALVPMVDLFAVLAIVFMIHSNEEITVAQTEVQEARNALEAFDEAEQARRERRENLAEHGEQVARRN